MRAQVTAAHLLHAISGARAMGGTGKYGYVWLEAHAEGIDVMGTDGVQITSRRAPGSLVNGEAGTYAVSHEDSRLLQHALEPLGALTVDVILTDAYVGLLQESRHIRVMVPQMPERIGDWRSAMSAKHEPGPKFALDSGRLRTVLNTMPSRVMLHLPEGDGQSIHFYSADVPGWDLWLMPLEQNVDPQAANYTKTEGGEAVAEA